MNPDDTGIPVASRRKVLMLPGRPCTPAKAPSSGLAQPELCSHCPQGHRAAGRGHQSVPDYREQSHGRASMTGVDRKDEPGLYTIRIDHSTETMVKVTSDSYLVQNIDKEPKKTLVVAPNSDLSEAGCPCLEYM
ncbi:unnamed protein product [Calypogeia fissa]